MATNQITNRDAKYSDPHLEEELIVVAEDPAVYRGRTVARFSLLWQERRFLFRSAALGMVASVLIVLLIPVRYTSTTRLMPPDQAGAGMASMLSALGKGGSELGIIGSELLGLRTSTDLFVGILHSRTIEDQLINKFDLRKVYGVSQWESARKVLESRTDVTADRKSGIVTIAVSDHSAERAAALAHEYVAALNHVVLTQNTSSAHKEREFLELRIGQVQQDLEKAEKDFGDFASKNTAIDVKEQGKAMITAAADLEGQLIAAHTELEGLQQIYTANNVRVRSLQARIEEYQRQLQKLGGKPESAGTGSTSTSDSYPSIRQLPILGVTYADLYRQTKVEEAVFEALTKQYEMAKVEEARETPSVKVLDEGNVPERKSFPPRTLFVLLGTVVAFSLGGAWILAYARWQEIDPQDPGKMLAEEILQTGRARVRGVVKRMRRSERRGEQDSSERE
jgi:capsule polysaccharide export protein KpsE/RkpR